MTWRDRLARWRGSAVQCDLAGYDEALDAIGRLEAELRVRSDRELTGDARALRAAVQGGTARGSVRDRFYALLRESSRRVLGQRPFDEQMVAALALDDGAIVEMQTGEGKTLAGVLPAALHALAGGGAHVLTFNDYLARRDAEWMAPVYEAVGLTVRCIQPDMTPDERRQAYRADVTYATAKEAGFDRLRDLGAVTPDRIVHRGFPFALVDEADSLLIDEARVPLVIAGADAGRTTAAAEAAALVADLTPGLHFDTDEYARDVELTDAGIEHLERVLACDSLHDPRHIDRLARVNCALHARALLHRDVDYIVRHGRIELVDDWTGRVVRDRRWPDGLQSALEAKEGLRPLESGRVLASLTMQRFLRGYSHVCGMTGTAQDGADELWATYGTPVVVIPTHRPMRRRDQPDLVYATREAKERAVVSEIHAAHAAGRPVLVGTRTVRESERLAAALAATRVPCQVLNARHDADEARIVAGAGAVGAVTIATNMAGRGTDIRMGGADEADHARVAALGGLYVIGTNRHESRRVDRQLRGRAGRQGDPGESRFFISLEDELLVRYGLDRLLSRRVPSLPPDQPLSHPIVGQEIARAQRIIEGQDFEIRQTLSRYSSPVEDQYETFSARRQAILHGESPGVWPRNDPRRAALIAAAGESAVDAAERAVALSLMDGLWSDHLAFCADCREGIHLMRLGGQDPLARFVAETTRTFHALDADIETAVMSSLDRVRAPGGMIDLSAAGITAPAATWTYLVNDDPFRDQMGLQLMGLGGRTASVYAAALLMPLLIAWGAIDRWRRRTSRRAPPPT